MAAWKTLLDLPAEMLWFIMLCVGADSTHDFVKMKLCCKMLKELGEHPYIWRSISLRGMSYHYNTGKHASFLRQCLANSNPEALYRAGVANFVGGNYPINYGGAVGLVQLRAASDADHLYATYTLGFLKIFNWDGDVPLLEEGYRLLGKVCRAGKELECRKNLIGHMTCFWPARKSRDPPPLPQAQCRKNHWKAVYNWSQEYEHFEDPTCIDCRCDGTVLCSFSSSNPLLYSPYEASWTNALANKLGLQTVLRTKLADATAMRYAQSNRLIRGRTSPGCTVGAPISREHPAMCGYGERPVEKFKSMYQHLTSNCSNLEMGVVKLKMDSAKHDLENAKFKIQNAKFNLDNVNFTMQKDSLEVENGTLLMGNAHLDSE